MLLYYYVNTTPKIDGRYEVHAISCVQTPLIKTTIPLGEFASCQEAINAAQLKYPKATGCYYCCKDCYMR